MTRFERRLMFVTEPSPRLPEIVAEAVEGGVDLVQWRDKTSPPRELARIGARLRQVTEGRAVFVVNGHPEIAREVGADGVHLPEAVTGSREAMGVARKDGWRSQAVHSVASALQAQNSGVGCLVAGTVFASQSHPDAEPAGLEFLRGVCDAVRIPVLAIGGVTPERVGDCLQAGAVGVAVLSPIMRAADPRGVARAYRAALGSAQKGRP